MHYFYILLSDKDKEYYYGSTINLRQRLLAHNKGNVSATKYRRPLRVVYYEAYPSIKAARLREQQVKASGSIRKAILLRLQDSDNSPVSVGGQPGHPQGSRASSSAG